MSSSMVILCPQLIETDHPSHERYTVSKVQSQIFIPNIPMPGPGLELRTLSCKANVLTTTLLRLSLADDSSLVFINGHLVRWI